MKLLGRFVFFSFMLWSAAASAQVARHPPGFERLEWRVKVSKHILSNVNRSKAQLRVAIKSAGALGSSGGRVLIGLVVSRSGQILTTEIVQSSGDPELDRLVERLVLRSSPLPRAPASFAGPTQRFVQPILIHGPRMSAR